MNLLSKIGASIGVASIMSGYLIFIIVPMAQIAESRLKTLRKVKSLGKAQNIENYGNRRTSNRLRQLFAYGGIAVLLSLYPAIKIKNGINWNNSGIISFFIGAAYGTHMFS